MANEELDDALSVGEFIVELSKQEGWEVQSVLCSKSRFKSADEARKWCSSHNFKSSKLDETDQYYRFRQFPPTQCTQTPRTKTLTKGVKAVICPRGGKCLV